MQDYEFDRKAYILLGCVCLWVGSFVPLLLFMCFDPSLARISFFVVGIAIWLGLGKVLRGELGRYAASKAGPVSDAVIAEGRAAMRRTQIIMFCVFLLIAAGILWKLGGFQ